MCKKIKLFYVIFFIFLFSSIVFLPSSLVYSAVPHLINYQGRLTDTSGAPLNGLYNITFRLYDAEAAGNLLWQGTYKSVSISKGIFSILLGDINDSGFNFEVLAFDKSYWLEIKVGDDVMTPRQRIASVGYAINADTIDNKHASDFIEQSSVAGGDLTGNYPKPTVKNIPFNVNKAVDTTIINTQSTTYVSTGFSLVYTPKFTGQGFLLIGSFNCSIDDGETISVKITDGTSTVWEGNMVCNKGSNDPDYNGQSNMLAVASYTASSANPVTFTVYYKSSSATYYAVMVYKSLSIIAL